MSQKTARLLHRSGRNQFGGLGDSGLKNYEQSAEPRAADERLITSHRALNDKFAQSHAASWLELFANDSRRQVWSKLHPHGNLALGTFYSMARECGSFEEFLTWWLVCHKSQALLLIGYSVSATHECLREFSDCGRYFVTYGKSRRTFGTTV